LYQSLEREREKEMIIKSCIVAAKNSSRGKTHYTHSHIHICKPPIILLERKKNVTKLTKDERKKKEEELRYSQSK